MENKINVAELLKDCPKGMELDCTMYEDASFAGITENLNFPIRVKINVENVKEGSWTKEITLTSEGKLGNHPNAKCVIFPKGKTTWEGFVPPCKFKDGDILVDNIFPFIYKDCDKTEMVKSYCGIDTKGNFWKASNRWTTLDKITFATEEQKEKLFQAIKDNGYRWNPETKTLEKLIGPKFKEIHFYKDSIGIGYLLESALKTHNATVLAVQNGWDTIYSYAISALDFSLLLDEGYKIFLHENGKCGELHEGTTELTDKELSKHHDIRRIWIGGGFEDFFYK